MRKTCIFWLLAGVAGLTQSFGQTSAGVNGVVLDSSGAAMPDTEITVLNLDTGAKRDAVTNESGVYQFSLLQPGRYSIAARRPGFKRVSRDGVQLEINQVAKIDFSLEPGAVTETIEVQAAATLLESNTQLIANRQAMRDPWKKTKIDNLALLLRAAIEAQGRVGLMLNVRRDKLADILSLLPALQRPTVSPLSDADWVAVNTIIEERTVRELIPRLKAADAHGIVEYPLNKIVV